MTIAPGDLLDAADILAIQATAASASTLASAALPAAGGLLTGPVIPFGALNVTAAGNTQGTATPVTAQRIFATTVAPGTGIQLPADLAPRRVFNRGANTLSVYPPNGAEWELLGANNPAGVAAGGSAEFQMVSAGQGYVA
jgi:hypothetical protein